MAKRILVIGTLDTKAKELLYLQRRIEVEGMETLLMDVSCKSKQSGFPCDVSCRTVAGEIGREVEEIAQLDKISAL